jgi:hypothetical protein
MVAISDFDGGLEKFFIEFDLIFPYPASKPKFKAIPFFLTLAKK